MRKALLLALLVTTVALAGCADPSQNGTPDNGDGPDDGTDEQGTPLPTWDLGEVWVYEVVDEGFGKQTVRMLNYKDDGSHYWLGAETKRKAQLHAIYSSIPVLGRIHIDNLAPHENGTHAAMFSFPLEDQKQWTGPLYGYQFDFKATERDDIPTPGGTSHGYEVEGRGPLAQINFNYADEVKWFTDLTLSTNDGRQLLKVTLKDHRPSESGPYHFMRADDFAKVTVGNTEITGQTESFEVPSNPTFGYLLAGIQGDWQGNVRVALVNPDGETQATWTRGGPTGGSGDVDPPEIIEVKDPKPGEWRLQYSSSGNSDLDVRVVGIKQYDAGSHDG